MKICFIFWHFVCISCTFLSTHKVVSLLICWETRCSIKLKFFIMTIYMSHLNVWTISVGLSYLYFHFFKLKYQTNSFKLNLLLLKIHLWYVHNKSLFFFLRTILSLVFHIKTTTILWCIPKDGLGENRHPFKRPAEARDRWRLLISRYIRYNVYLCNNQNKENIHVWQSKARWQIIKKKKLSCFYFIHSLNLDWNL